MLERGKISQQDKNYDNLAMIAQEEKNIFMMGEFRDVIKDTNGNVIEETPVTRNIIVQSILPLIMCLFKAEPGYAGFQYWAIGSGEAGWDTDTPPPDKESTHLTTEFARKAITYSDIVFLDANLDESATPTNIIEVVVTFDENEAIGAWREFGIFGGNATTALNSGVMVNNKRHQLINKTNDIIVERHLRFTLNLN